MKFKKLTTLLAFISLSLLAISQNSTISGTVVDSKTLKPIPNANVIVEGFEPVKSNSLGNFQLWSLPYGEYSLRVTEGKYSTFYQQITLDADYKYIRVRMGEITSVSGSETNNTEQTPTIKETLIVRDTVYIDRIVEVPVSNSTSNTPAEVVDYEKPTNIDLAVDSPTLELPLFSLDELEDAEDNTDNSNNVSTVLSASRDPFYNTAAFTLGTYRLRLRGLDNANGKLYMNNIEMNDLGIGRPSWTQWGGLNDVLKTRSTTFGLEKSDFAFGGLLGSSNIDIRASKQRKQLKLSYAFSNRSYMHRVMGTYSSGMMKGGWAVSVSGSWRYANSNELSEKIRFNQNGTTYDAYSFFAGVDKQFGKNHLLSLNVFGSRNKRGKNAPATQEIMDIAGSNYYNPNWGWQTEPDGKRYKRNAKVGEVFIPTAILMHEWKMKNNSSLKTSFSFRKGINGSSTLDWNDATDPRPDYYRNMPSFANLSNGSETAEDVTNILTANEDVRQINWDKLYEANYLSTEVVNNPNGSSDTGVYNIAKYVLAERHYDPTTINMSSIYENILNDNVKFTLGINYANQKTHNYQKIKDLLGAEYYIDLNQFAERDFPGNDSIAQNDLNNPNRLLKEGDKYGYNYTFNIRKTGLWAQTALSLKNFDFYIANDLTFSSFSREGHVKNGLFPDNSEGLSEVKHFANFTIKGGLTYKINGRNYIFGNASFGTRAPYIRNAMLSPRTRNDFIPDLKSEKLFSGELGYLLKAPKFKVRAVAYIAEIRDQSSNRGVYFDAQRAFGTYIINGINTRNYGFELGAEYEPLPGFTITPVIAWGDQTYISRPSATLIQDNSNEPIFEDRTLYYKGLHLANGPQAAYSLGLGYRTSSYWFFSVRGSYFDKIFIDASPTRRTLSALDNVEPDSELWVALLSQERRQGQFVLDASVGKSFRFKDKNEKSHYLNFNVNVGNITNNTKFVTGGFEQYRFNKADGNLDRFQNRYFYSYGLNFFVGVSYRF